MLYTATKSLHYFPDNIASPLLCETSSFRYWAPIQWSVNLVYECKALGKIEDYYLMNKIVEVSCRRLYAAGR